MGKVDTEAVAKMALDKAWEIRTSGARVVPMWFLVKGEKVSVLATDWRGESEKREMVAKVAARVRERRADAVVFVSDSWVRLRPEGAGPMSAEERHDYLTTKPSQAVDAMEALVSQVYLRGPSLTLIRAYRQDDAGGLEVVSERHLEGGRHLGAVAEPVQRAVWGR